MSIVIRNIVGQVVVMFGDTVHHIHPTVIITILVILHHQRLQRQI